MTDCDLTAWADTWFGDPAHWDPALTAAAQACLRHPDPVTVSWGPDFRLLYNHAYAELIGDQHPGARGRPGWESQPAMWPVVGPQLQGVLATGEPYRCERAPLPRRTPSGTRTEWYRWEYLPVWASERVVGVFAIVHEETAVELTDQHDRAERTAAGLPAAADLRAALVELVRVLGRVDDVRLVTCHLVDADGRADRVAFGGPTLRHPAAASLLDHAERAGHWPAGADRAVVPLSVRRGLTACWCEAFEVDGRTVVLTVGFSPQAGDPREQRRFFEAVLASAGAPARGPARG